MYDISDVYCSLADRSVHLLAMLQYTSAVTHLVYQMRQLNK